MSGGTPEWQKEKVRTYFQATNERSYLANWAGRALSFHFGLSDEHTTSLDQAHEASNAYLAEALAIGEGTRVLDAGSGVGGTSIWLANERRANVIGVTLDPAQVALANGFAKERGAEGRVAFHVMDFAATTFAPASFDVVLNLESLCHCIDVPAYFAHVRELLAGGGIYGCMDFFPRPGDDDRARIEQVKEGWAMPAWQPLAAVERALRDAGFEDVETFDLTPRVRRSAEQMRAMASNTLLVSKLQRAIDGAADPLHEGHVRAAIACSEGLLSGSIEYAFVRGRRPRR